MVVKALKSYEIKLRRWECFLIWKKLRIGKHFKV